MRWLAILYVSTALSCASNSPTGIDLTISYPGDIIADSLLIRGHSAGSRAFEPGIVPEISRDLAPRGENIIIVVPSKLASDIIDIRVDALWGDEVLYSGRVSLRLVANTVVSARVFLDGYAICGDDERVDWLEDCDDGNEVDGDGCSADCFVERGWVCAGAPSACDPCVADLMCRDDRDFCGLECPAATCSCMLRCGDDARRCNPDCSDSYQCQIDCGTSDRCNPRCSGQGGVCFIDCAGTGRCDAECSGSSTCTIACADGAPCTARCRDQAACLLDCGDASRCELEGCKDGAVSCAGNVIVCGRECP